MQLCMSGWVGEGRRGRCVLISKMRKRISSSESRFHALLQTACGEAEAVRSTTRCGEMEVHMNLQV